MEGGQKDLARDNKDFLECLFDDSNFAKKHASNSLDAAASCCILFNSWGELCFACAKQSVCRLHDQQLSRSETTW